MNQDLQVLHDHLAGLYWKVDKIKRGRKTPGDFYRLAKAMEAYRDQVRDFLDGLSAEERSRIDSWLWPAVYILVRNASSLAGLACLKDGIIDVALVIDIGMVGNSLLFVSSLSKRIV